MKLIRKLRKIDKHLSFQNVCATSFLGRMFHPTIDLLFQISTTSHPRDGARNPQKKGVSQSTHNSISHNPLVFSYNYPKFPPTLFLLTYPTQGMYPFTALSPSGIPFVYQGLLAQVTRNLSTELKGTHYQENY
jgi:hypothetical protein